MTTETQAPDAAALAAPAPQAAADMWRDVVTADYESDDLVWLYDQGSNTIDGPRPFQSSIDPDRYTHWAPCEAPSTKSIDGEAAPTGAAPAVAEERDRLRAAQAAAVMPLIGPLLDAWESSDHDALEGQTELVKRMEAINFAMETAGDDPQAPAPAVAADEQPRAPKSFREPDPGTPWWQTAKDCGAWTDSNEGDVGYVHFGSTEALRVYTMKIARQAESAAIAQRQQHQATGIQAPAVGDSEERRQLQHLLDDIVEEADQDGHTYYRIRDGKDILFSNMVAACARLLAQPVPLQLETAEEARKDRAHAEAYYRQAERLLTANEQTLREALRQIDAALQGTLANATDMRDMAEDVDAAQQIARAAIGSHVPVQVGESAQHQAVQPLTDAERMEAARYRAIRDGNAGEYAICEWIKGEDGEGFYQDARAPEIVDAAIDAAMGIGATGGEAQGAGAGRGSEHG